jgi:hypothetical protein
MEDNVGILNNIVGLIQRKQTESPDGLARDLLQELVLNPSRIYFDKSPTPVWNSATEQTKLSYYEKTCLYKSAALLMILIQLEQTDHRASVLKTEVEKTIFPKDVVIAAPLIEDVNNAMKDLSDFMNISDSSRRALWAMEWLKEAGLNETDPWTLGFFTLWLSKEIGLLRDSVALAIKKFM